MTLLVESAVKISLVIGPALLIVALLRRRSAALRHWILAAATLAALTTPLLIALGPSWSLPVEAGGESVARNAASMAGAFPVPRVEGGSETVVVNGGRQTASARALDPGFVFLAVWAAGVTVSLIGLLVGVLRLHRIAAHAEVVTTGPWWEQARALEDRYSLSQPVRLLQSDRPALLVTWGFFSPKILLPADAHTWSADRIHVVLAHELAHVVRGDWALQLAGEMLRVVFWFHPLIWLSSARLRLESERACDDAVVNLGVEGHDYAEHLLDLARQFGRSRQPIIPAVAIASRPSVLYQRVAAMLNTHLSRRPMSLLARVVVLLAAALIAIPVALFAQNTFATISGSITDESSGFLPGVVVVMTDTQRGVRHQVRTDGTGRFEIMGLPQGPYTLEAALPGFQTVQQILALSGQDVSRDITMPLGKLQEMVVVSNQPSEPKAPSSQVRGALKPSPCGDSTRTTWPAPVRDGARRIGGQIAQPHKLRHVSPIYPAGSSPGVVRMDTLIGIDGYVKELTVTNDAAPELARSAEDAVRQWHFSQTLLNCVPVDVKMSVVVEFR